MESISTDYELSLYRLDRKWNDYIGVQKEVQLKPFLYSSHRHKKEP